MANALMASYLGAALHFTTSLDPIPLTRVLAPIVDANLTGFLTKKALRSQHRKD